MTGLSSRRGRLPLRRIRAPRWAEQEGTWRQAAPELIAAALQRARARPSGNWFALAASREIAGERPFGRTVAGVELVAWRDGGELRVGAGACPHLGAPLREARVHGGNLICRWHGMCLGAGSPGWRTYPAHDDGVLAWVRLDEVGGESPLERPVLPARPPLGESVDAVATAIGVCEPEDVVANRLDPWHGSWFHPYSFANLEVLREPDAERDEFEVAVSFRLTGGVGVPVRATFAAPEPRTVVMRIVDGEGVGSVVETHATPLGRNAHGHPTTAVIEAVVAHSTRPGFRWARAAAAGVRPVMRWAALRLWRDDLAYAERRRVLRERPGP